MYKVHCSVAWRNQEQVYRIDERLAGSSAPPIGKIVQIIGVWDSFRSGHLPAVVIRVVGEGRDRVVLTIVKD
jgi:hypothetical protein